MKTNRFSNKTSKVLALVLTGYLSLTSIVTPVTVLSGCEYPCYPVSAPITIPVIIPSPTPTPSSVPFPSSVPTATPSATEQPRPTPIPANIVIINPGKGRFSTEVTLNGSEFGSKQGSIIFYNQVGQASAGAPIVFWSNNRVRFLVPAVAKGIYQIEVKRFDGRKSNRVNFEVTAGQPQINSILPIKLKIGQYFIITGSELGKPGKVNFYKPGSSVIAGSAENVSWLNSLIIAKIPQIKGNLDYGIQVRTADDRNSALTYRFINK